LFAKDSPDRFLPRLAPVLLRLSRRESGLALAGHGAVRLLDALGVRAARVGLAARLLNTSKQGISSSSLWTRADGVSGFRVANSSGAARIRIARILKAGAFFFTGGSLNWQAGGRVINDVTLFVPLAGVGLLAGVDTFPV